jgi:hypothetical protein
MRKCIEKELSWNKVSKLLVDYFETIIKTYYNQLAYI